MGKFRIVGTSALLALWGATGLGSEVLPPVGKRVYITEKDEKNRYAPLKVTWISKVPKKGEIVFRDPVLVGEDEKGGKEKRGVKKLMVSDKSNYELAPLTVRASVSQPEIPFKGVKMIIDRADQPLPDNFLHKIDKDLPDL